MPGYVSRAFLLRPPIKPWVSLKTQITQKLFSAISVFSSRIKVYICLSLKTQITQRIFRDFRAFCDR